MNIVLCWCVPEIPVLEKWRQEDQEFTLSYVVSSRPAWTELDTASNKQEHKQQKMRVLHLIPLEVLL